MDEIDDGERTSYLLIKRAAGFLILEELGAVRQAVAQIRSLVSDAVPPLSELVSAAGGAVNDDVQRNAIRSLQFADMVEQLGAYCDAELDNVVCLARDLNHLVNEIMGGNTEALAQLAEFRHNLDERLDNLRLRLADRGHKSVVQDNMTEGDIELF